MACRIFRNDNLLQPILLAVMVLIYGPLLWFSWKLSPHDSLNFTFNSMLEHLLHGRFDVDPGIVKDEGYAHDGRVYSYWGIWCGLLRIPLWMFHRLDVDATVWSCLVAVCVAGMAKVRTLFLLHRQGKQNAASTSAFVLMLVYALFGGSQIGYLRISVYQEVIFWAYAFACIFVYFAIKGLMKRRFSLSTLNWMAVCAGLALLTRVSTGVGLIVAFGLLLLLMAAQSFIGNAAEGFSSNLPPGSKLLGLRLLIPLGILAVLIFATGMVNYFRWGNPSTFANFSLSTAVHPAAILEHRSNFDIRRIPLAMVYYFVPVWVLHENHGHYFAQLFERWFFRVELPPSSLFFTDLLPLCFMAFLADGLRKSRVSFSYTTQYALVVLLGLFSLWLLILSYISLAYRYRMELYPLIDFLSFLGFYLVLTREASLAVFSRYRRWIVAALAVSVVSSFTALLLYDFSLSTGRSHAYFHQAVQGIYRIVDVF